MDGRAEADHVINTVCNIPHVNFVTSRPRSTDLRRIHHLIMASVDISLAVEEDFPILAHIAAVAMSVDLVHRIIYEGNNPFDTTRQERSVMAELHRAASNPEAHVYKAVLKSSQEIVGYAMLRFENNGQSDSANMKPVAPKFSPGTNARFLEHMMSRVKALHSKHLDNIRHICQSFGITC